MFAAILNYRRKSAFITTAHTLYSLSLLRLRFKMSLTGRTLNILGRSATRVRCTGLQRLRSEYAEGPGNVSVLISLMATCVNSVLILVTRSMAFRRHHHITDFSE